MTIFYLFLKKSIIFYRMLHKFMLLYSCVTFSFGLGDYGIKKFFDYGIEEFLEDLWEI